MKGDFYNRYSISGEYTVYRWDGRYDRPIKLIEMDDSSILDEITKIRTLNDHSMTIINADEVIYVLNDVIMKRRYKKIQKIQNNINGY